MHLPACLTAFAVCAAAAVAPPCDTARSPAEVCEDFCNHRCGFYNHSDGDTGRSGKLTLYRLTPDNVTGLGNKNTGDPPGDIGYWLTKKNLTRECALNPQGQGCIDNGDNIYAAITLEVDGQFGPYLQCNPLHVGGVDPVMKPLWKDTRSFVCGMNCLYPTETGCHGNDDHPDANGSNFDGSYHCHCAGSRRDARTVGRAQPPFLAGKSWAPDDWVPQCKRGYFPAPMGTCLESDTLITTVHGWSFESTLALACKACSADPSCTAWVTTDNVTAKVFAGHVLLVEARVPCTSAFASNWSKRSSWFGVGDLGGYWYSTPTEGECPAGMPLGTGGCTWREVASLYKNASCVDGWVDAAVEDFGAGCFGRCPQPLNRTSDCYLNCYRTVLQGDASLNLTKIPDSKVVEPWVRAFEKEDLRHGGCPTIVPGHCQGAQCDPLMPPRRQDDLAIVV